jgi:hypothetical protein
MMRKSIIVIGLFVLLIPFSFSNVFAWWWGGTRDICEFPGIDDAKLQLDLRFNEPGVPNPQPGGGVKLIITFVPEDLKQLEEIRNSIKEVRFKNDSGISIRLKNHHGWFVDEENPYIEIDTSLGRSDDLLGIWKYVIYAKTGIFSSGPMELTNEILSQPWPNPITDFTIVKFDYEGGGLLIVAKQPDGPADFWLLRMYDGDVRVYNGKGIPDGNGNLIWWVRDEETGAYRGEARFETRYSPEMEDKWWPSNGCSGSYSHQIRAVYHFMLEEPSP